MALKYKITKNIDGSKYEIILTRTIINFEKEILLILNNKVQDTDQTDYSPSKNNNNITFFSQSHIEIAKRVVKILDQEIFKSQNSIFNFTLDLLDNNLAKKIPTML